MEKIGKYEIIEELGRGAMGKVYKAHDPQIDRFVAIKVISESVQDYPQIRERFQREARSAGKLSHENITVVFDYGEVEGMPYIVMEYLEGSELREVVDNKASPLTLFDKLNLAVQICNGLQYAHSKQIVHRDIKPENIRVLEDGKVKIMDFGIAKLDTTTYTQVGVAMGTPFYMSPEQIVGQKIDKRTDIFAFGVVLHELLTGDRPFKGETVPALMYCIRHEAPQIRIKDTGFDEALVKIVSKCLEKERDSRYRDFADVRRDISEIIKSGQQRISPPPENNQARTLTLYPQARQRILRARVMIPALLVLLIGSASGWIYFKKPDLNLKNLLAFGESQSPVPLDSLKLKPTNGDIAQKSPPPDSITKPQQETKEIEAPRQINTQKPKPDPLLAEIERAKQNLLNAKLEVPGTENEKNQDSNYQQALQKETSAQEQLDAGNLQASLRLFRQASDLFAKAPESILNAQKDKADEARTAMKKAKVELDPAAATEEKYQQGVQAEAEGDQAYDDHNYTRAKERYQTALTLYTQANINIIARKTADIQKRQEVENAIQDVLRRYQESLEQGDIDQLRDLYRSFTDQEEKRWSDMFKFSTERKVNIGIEEKTVKNDRATLDLVVRVRFKDNKNREQDLPYNYTWTLEQIGGNWVISEFVARK